MAVNHDAARADDTVHADDTDVPFARLPLEQLRRRRSAKWTRYGEDVMPAWVAEMDFPLAPPVQAVLRRAIDDHDCGYLDPQGTELGEVFAGYAKREHDWVVDPSAVVPTTDVMVGAAEMLRRLAGPGAGVLVNPPVYPPFFSTIAEVGCRVVEAPLAPPGHLARTDGRTDGGPGAPPGGRYELDLDAVERGFAAGARVYLLCNPHNPVGRVYDRDDLLAVAELAARYDATVVADEIHAPLVLAGARHQPFVALGGEAARRGVTLMSASKGWNLAGLKCGVFVTEPGPMRDVVADVPVDARYRTGHLGALAAMAAWQDGGAWIDDVRRVLEHNRARLADLLAEHLPQVGYVAPEASFLTWLDCRALGLGADPAAAFLAAGRVAVSSGPDFGEPGRGYARLNIGTSPELVTEAVRRMAAAVPD